MIHDLEAHPKLLLHPVCEWLTSIAAVGPDHLETRHLSGQRLEQELAPCSISDLSRQDFDAQQQPLRVHQEMPFSALNFFPWGQKSRPTERNRQSRLVLTGRDFCPHGFFPSVQ